MMNIIRKNILRGGMSACSMIGITRFFRRKQTGACILMYHGFIEGKPAGLENHSRLHLDIRGFRHTAKMLAKHYNVIPLQQLADMMGAGRPIPLNTVVLTFDDGYASNYHLALPVLEKFGLHATVFASTGFIEREFFQWPDRIEYAIGHCPGSVLDLDFPGLPERLDLGTQRLRKEALLTLDPTIKKVPQARLLECLDHIEKRAGAALADEPDPPAIYLPMTWEQLREMERSAHASIGSHTHIHAILGNCEASFARQEMVRCTRLLREKGGVENPTFAYPNGQPGDFDKETRNLLKELGYSVAVTTVMDFNHPGQDLMELKRMATPRNGYQADTMCSGLVGSVKKPVIDKIGKLLPISH